MYYDAYVSLRRGRSRGGEAGFPSRGKRDAGQERETTRGARRGRARSERDQQQQDTRTELSGGRD